MIIDISHHQVPSKIDYKKLCNQLSMAIIRVQYGSKLIDRHYKTHIAGMKNFNVPFGVYAWVRGINERDMEVEATDFHNRSKDLDPLFYVLDVEEDSMANMRAGINAYVKKLRSLTNKKIGVYIGHHLYKSFNLDLSKFDFVWIPRYGVNNGKVDKFPDYPCDIHQYTENGRLDGYPGNLDLNRLTGSKPLSFFTEEDKKEEEKQEEEVSLIKINLHGKDLQVDGIFKNKTNYISVRFLEKLGYEVGWDDKKKVVTIKYKREDK